MMLATLLLRALLLMEISLSQSYYSEWMLDLGGTLTSWWPYRHKKFAATSVLSVLADLLEKDVI